MNEQPIIPSTVQNKKRTRIVSKYSFPYYDLETCIGVATALHDRAGGKANMAQLASFLGHKDETSGAFRAKVWGAQIFGLANIKGRTVTITPLGEQLASVRTGIQRDKRLAEAFLNVPLFKEVFTRYEDSTLPSTREGLKKSLQSNFGVPSTVLSPALKTLEASAEHAGFKREDPNRLIHPVPAGLMEAGDIPKSTGEDAESHTLQTNARTDIHPAINGFLQELPSKDERWTEGERERWINAFTAMVKALYPIENE